MGADNLNPAQRHDYEVNIQDHVASLQDAAAQLPQEAQKQLALAVTQKLPASDQQDILSQLAPDQGTTNLLWSVVVWTFSLIAGATVITLALIALGFQFGGHATDAKTMLTVFTGVIGFLAGLLAPSPVRSKS